MKIVGLWQGDDIPTVTNVAYVFILMTRMLAIVYHHIHKVRIPFPYFLVAEEVAIAGIAHTLLHRITMLTDGAITETNICKHLRVLDKVLLSCLIVTSMSIQHIIVVRNLMPPRLHLL